MKECESDIAAVQKVLRASDEEIAGRAGCSTNTFKKVRNNLRVRPETKRSLLNAMEQIRQEQLRQLSSLNIKAVGY